MKKEVGQEPPPGYTLRDAFKLWCGLKRGRIVSYQDERRRLERYLIGPIGSRQLDAIRLALYRSMPQVAMQSLAQAVGLIETHKSS